MIAQIYSGVDSRIIGLVPEVEVGPMSGRANVILKLRKLGIKPTDRMVKSIIEAAK